jgi:hypothetical protein
MTFTVRWRRHARDQLTTVWLASTNRKAVTAAANRIDALLGRDPVTRGESRDGERRVLIESPLGIYFTIDSPNRVVRVLSVWSIEHR